MVLLVYIQDNLKVLCLQLLFGHCCDLTFQADSRQIPILEHLHIIKVLMQPNATIMFKDYRCSL